MDDEGNFAGKLAEALGLDTETDLPAFEPTFPAEPGTLAVQAVPESGVAIVGYLCHDHDVEDFFENDGGAGNFTPCRTPGEVEALLSGARGRQRVALVVEKYEHGLSHYSVAGSGNYPDRRWDVGTAGVLVPCDDVQSTYRSATRAAKAAVEALDPGMPGFAAETARLLAEPMAGIVRDSNSVLDEYSKWANGEVFGVVVEAVRWDAGTSAFRKVGEEDACWGHIGVGYAKEALEEAMGRFADGLDRHAEIAATPGP